MKKRTLILLGSGLVLGAGVIYLLTRKNDVLPINTEKPIQSNTLPPIVTIEKAGINVYAENSGKIGKVTRYTKSANEKAGKFIGYQTINQNVYVVFNDIYNKGIKSLVLKSLTNYKNK